MEFSARIKETFSDRASQYHQHAVLQEEVAGRVAASLEPWRHTLPAGPVLEVGAGTGFLTQKLADILPERKLLITDLSPAMVEACRTNLSGQISDAEFRMLDAELFQPEEELYALIAGNFVAQWFKDPAFTLERLAEALQPDGLLLMSFPGHESFPEWRDKCLELGLPFTGNPLPNTEEMVIKLSTGPGQVDYYEDAHVMEFQNSRDFFRFLKQTGADTATHDKQLSPKQLKLLMRHWDESNPGPIRVTWHLVFLVFKKNG